MFTKHLQDFYAYVILKRKGFNHMRIQNNIAFTGSNGFLDKLHTYSKNSADMNDTIIVPRTIFKGYLGIMTGTTLVTLAGLVDKKKSPKLFKGTMATGLLTSMYGTWAFVRPFIIKD